jgi:general secretion pathway protein D
MARCKRWLTVGSAMVLILGAPGSGVPVALAQANADVVVNMRDVELSAVAEQVSRITGRTLILDPGVQGRVNVVSADPLTPAGVWDLFLSVLRVHGYAAVRSGNAWRVVPQAAAVQSGGTTAGGGPVRSQDIVTRMIRLRNLSSESALRALKPLVASFGSIEALTDPNAVVVTDYAENVRRIEQLARSLDQGGGTAESIAIVISHADARDVAESIRVILGEGPGGARLSVDERSNTILVRADPGDLVEARRIAATLDTPAGAAQTTRLFRLNHADAESVTEVLRGLMGGGEAARNPVARSLAPGGRSSSAETRGQPASLSQRLGVVAGATEPAVVAASGGASGGAGGFFASDLAVQPAPELNAIVVRGSAAAIASIEPLIQQLDVRRPQVMIEAIIVEITGDQAEQLGVQFGFGAAAPLDGGAGATAFSNQGLSIRDVLSALGAPASVGLIRDGLSAGYGQQDEFAVLVQALGRSTRANLLSTPSLTTLDNQPAEFVVGQNVPFRTGSFVTEGITGAPFTTIEREDVGITLRVVPRVHSGDTVRLEVSQEVSSLVDSNVAGAADLITNRRNISTTVLADNGQTIMLGGLTTDDRLSSESKVPLLGDVPGLGRLFRNDRESRTKRTLFVFLRPTILRDSADVVREADRKYRELKAHDRAPEPASRLLEPTRPRLPESASDLY